MKRTRRTDGSLRHLLIGTATIALLALLALAIDLGVINSLFAPSGQTITVRFTDTEQLRVGDPVREHGVNVGTVKSMRLDPGGRTATVELTIEQAGRPVYANARARLRWRTVLGGSYAVDLDPGTAASGELGSRTIPPDHTSAQIEVDDVLSVDQGGAQRGLRTMLGQVPDALASSRAPSEALGALAARTPSLATAASAVQGESERDLAPLIASTARTMAALDTPVTTARDLVQGAAASTAVTAARASDLAGTIDQLAADQPAIDRTFRQIDGTLALADPLIARLQRPATQLGPSLRRLRPATLAAGRLLAHARPLLDALPAAVSTTASAAVAGRPVLVAAAPSVRRLAGTILPNLAETDAVTKLTSYEMIGPDLASLDSAAASFNAQGHLFHFPANIGEHVLSDDLPCTTDFTDPQSQALIACETLTQALGTYSAALSRRQATR